MALRANAKTTQRPRYTKSRAIFAPATIQITANMDLKDASAMGAITFTWDADGRGQFEI